jgi:hypothetical protein
MKRKEFVKVAEEALDSLPEEFRSRIQNVAILVEDVPPNQSSPDPDKGDCFWASFTACLRRREVSSTCPQGRITSCFIRRILKRSAQARSKCVIKFARLSYMNWGTILV